MNISVGNKLKKLRKKEDLSQEQVASSLHVSQSTYARIERGESSSWASHINTICEVFKISPEDLIKEEDKEESNNLNETLIINQLSDKVIEQYEARIKELKKVIKDLKRKRDL